MCRIALNQVITCFPDFQHFSLTSGDDQGKSATTFLHLTLLMMLMSLKLHIFQHIARRICSKSYKLPQSQPAGSHSLGVLGVLVSHQQLIEQLVQLFKALQICQGIERPAIDLLQAFKGDLSIVVVKQAMD